MCAQEVCYLHIGIGDTGWEAVRFTELSFLPKASCQGEVRVDGMKVGMGTLLDKLPEVDALVKLRHIITVWDDTEVTQIEKCPLTSLSTQSPCV